MVAAPHLTPRELDVLREYRRTHSYKETGTALGISPNTVHAHIRSITLKLEVDGGWRACEQATALGILEPAA